MHYGFSLKIISLTDHLTWVKSLYYNKYHLSRIISGGCSFANFNWLLYSQPNRNLYRNRQKKRLDRYEKSSETLGFRGFFVKSMEATKRYFRQFCVWLRTLKNLYSVNHIWLFILLFGNIPAGVYHVRCGNGTVNGISDSVNFAFVCYLTFSPTGIAPLSA